MPQSVQDSLWEGLPEVYRKEGTTGFTYRLLGMFADILGDLEQTILALHKHLDPQEVPAAFLPWLASWVALELDVTWDEQTRRDLIDGIVEIYKRRGTVPGVKELVKIYTGVDPTIIEHFDAGWRVGVRSTVGVDTTVYGGHALDAHRFSVIVNVIGAFNPELRDKIRERVLIEKPSWTQLVSLTWEPEYFAQVGVRATVGVDLQVGGY